MFFLWNDYLKHVMLMDTWDFCQIDVVPVWNAWGHALIRMEHYAQARVKFKYV